MISAPSRKAPIRRAVPPGPHAPRRSSQYGSVKNGQTSTLSTKTDQRAIGDISAREPRDQTRRHARDPEEDEQDADAHPQEHARRPEPRHEEAVEERREPEAAGDDRSSVRDGKSAHPKRHEQEPEHGEQNTVRSVFPGVV